MFSLFFAVATQTSEAGVFAKLSSKAIGGLDAPRHREVTPHNCVA